MVKKIQINMSNKVFYTLITIGVITLLAIGVYAYGSAVPATMGHSSEEIVVDNTLCTKITGHGCGTDIDTDTNTWRPVVTATSTHHVKTVDTNTWRPVDNTLCNAVIGHNCGVDNTGGNPKGIAIYQFPGACGGHLGTTSTCQTMSCEICDQDWGCYSYYTDCAGRCGYGRTTCTTTHLGYLVN